jgi:hypothetical protein
MLFKRTSFACCSKNCLEGTSSSSPAYSTRKKLQVSQFVQTYNINGQKEVVAQLASILVSGNLKNLMKQSTHQSTCGKFGAF